MSKTTTFEAWADFDYARGLICEHAEDLRDERDDGSSSRWVGGESVRVRVTVEMVEEAPQE